jgi:carbonic anhydrase/acetyltransferase-like protein (isoleucine patch superfamily)
MPIYSFDNFLPVIATDTFIAPTAIVIGQVEMKEKSSIWFGTVARADINSITIGAQSNIQDGCMMHVTHTHPVVVEDRVTAGHGVILHGCHVKSDCLIGMGAVLLDGVVVGENSIIAAGAVLAPGTIIPSGSMVMGVPGKVVRDLKEEEKNRIRINWQAYVHYSKEYLGGKLVEIN